MNLEVLERPEAILGAARAATALTGKRGQVQGHNLSLPHEVMQRSGRSGDANHLIVPSITAWKRSPTG